MLTVSQVVPEPATTAEPTTEATTTISSTSYTTVTVSVSPSPTPDLPTNVVTVYPTPGTYTIDPTTIVVTEETTVCDATSTAVDPGEHTYGGVTTVVETATTVTCPIATVKPTGDTTTSVIETTTFVCPSGGTYTIAPTTTSVPESTVIVYPTPAEITTGTYTQPGQTLTVTETDFVYICPKPTGPPPPPASTTAAPPPPPPPSSKPAPPPPSSTKPAPKPSNPPTPDLGGGKKWGMTYSPYTDEGECKGAAAVAIDIALIKTTGFKAVRIYSTDCDGLKNVGTAAKLNGLRMIIGVFVSETGAEGAKEQVKEIVEWGQFDLVDLIVVGNEAIFGGRLEAKPLVDLITYAAGAFKEAGYDGPITTTEPTNVWQEHGKALCPVIDVLGANLHCFFNTEVKASECGSFVKDQMSLLGDICNKKVVNLETGWPSSGKSNGAAIAGTSEQNAAIKSLIKEVGPESVFFSFGNDPWKEPGPFGIEQFWGCIELFG